MSQKNETPILILSLLITAGLIGAGAWWFINNNKINLNQTSNSKSTSSKDTTPWSSNGVKNKTFTAVTNIPTGLFNYGGSTSWAPIRLAVDAAVQANLPEFRLRYTEPTGAKPGSSTGIQMLINGQIAFAQSSRPLNDTELARAQQRRFSLKQIPVAIDGLAFAIHPDLQIPGLTVNQLKSIYTGKTTNWRQVGGPNIPIRAYSRPITAGGTVELFVQDTLGGEAFAANVELVPTTTQALRKVANSLGSIYFASAPEVVPQCSIRALPLGRTQGQYVAPYQEPFVKPTECPGKRNQLNIEAFRSGNYPITRNLFVVVKQNGRAEQQAGTAYANLLLTEQGQKLISQQGFVRIR
ncbi:MAG: substrate-binding domain-containing protein [Richelia sp.]|nr:substrate-binding domain-containing protein [Richelia sp.]CDN11589.1 Phosphate ABC transporter, periplasmic phosphate-binding protein PstS (TC 3.A.1.7.1) [Richelia intracellularis]